MLLILLIFTGCSVEYADDNQNDSDYSTSSEETSNLNEGSGSETGGLSRYKVIRVVDGDTIVIDYEGTDEKVRMIGIDTPESVHPDKEKNTEFGDTVSAFTKEQLEGKWVGLELDVQERDQYGRLLAYVYLDDVMYNKTLLENGYAAVSTYPPNVKYVDEFTAIQKKARDDGINMWSDDYKASSSSDSSNSTETQGYKGHIKNKKFHKSGCRYGEMISYENLIIFTTREIALDEGYAACKVCKP